MSLEYWDLQTGPDSRCNDFERVDGRGSALFAQQPQYATREVPVFSPRYNPYPTFTRRVRIFKNIATVPDITLTYAQTEGAMPLGTTDSTFSPLLTDSSPSLRSIETRCYTPPLSFTPTSVTSDLSPCTSDQTFILPSYPLSPLFSDSMYLSDTSALNVSPLSAAVDLPSLELFTDSPEEPEVDSDSRDSSPVLNINPTTNSTYDVIVESESEDEEQENSPAKRRRYTPAEPELESAPTRPQGLVVPAKKVSRNRIGKTRRQGPAPRHTPNSSKHVLEFSSGNWLKLTPPSMTELTSPSSHPSPPPSLSPAVTPELSNVRKRKRAMTSPLVTPLQPPLPVRLVSVGRDIDSPSPSSPISIVSEECVKEDPVLTEDYIYQDFIAARAMAQRRSGRTRAPISYADCDEAIPEKPARGKTKTTAGKAKAESDEFKAQATRNVFKGRRGGHKASPTSKSRCECPFQIICSIPFGRFSDVVRHLESNVLHTHAEKSRWECPQCGARLARADSYKRHIDARACGKRAPTEKVKPVYSPEVEMELERIRNTDHPAILAAKDRL